MKAVNTLFFVVLTSLISLPGMAAMPGMDHSSHTMQSTAASDTQMVEGQVKKIDKAAGKVTLAHGPLTNLGMNMGMTMAFRVKETAWLDQMKEGDKIHFSADSVNGVLTIISFEPAK